MTDFDKRMMAEAIKEAKIAAELGEIPVGAVVTKDGEIVGRGHNDREQRNSPLGHAELNAIADAAARLGDWRLSGCTIYVTLEPCPMCAGGILSARMERVCYGAADEAAGCFGSLLNMAHLPNQTAPKITAGVLEAECRELLADFFEKLRENGKK